MDEAHLPVYLDSVTSLGNPKSMPTVWRTTLSEVGQPAQLVRIAFDRATLRVHDRTTAVAATVVEVVAPSRQRGVRSVVGCTVARAKPLQTNEFVFRFNRRRSRSRGLVFYRVLELAVGHDPVRYRTCAVNHASVIYETSIGVNPLDARR